MITSKRARWHADDLHNQLLGDLGDAVQWHSDVKERPLDLDLQLPLPSRARAYIYRLSQPSRGVEQGYFDIRLRAPRRQQGERARFDVSDGRIILMLGYDPEIEVYALWDPVSYSSFGHNRSVQVDADAVHAALGGKLATSEITHTDGDVEVVLTAPADRLREAILERQDLTDNALVGGFDGPV